MNKQLPTRYEEQAIMEIHVWKNPAQTWWRQAIEVINAPIDFVIDAAGKIPGIEFVMEKAVGGVLSMLNDGAAATVRPKAVFEDFQPTVSSLEEIHDLDLEKVDRAIGFLAAKYKSIAAAEGAAAGAAGNFGPAAGAAAIAADVTALLTLNLRAVSEYATYCGFDITKQQERLFALNVLGLASSPTDASKAVAMAQLVKIAKEVAQKKAWKELEKHLFVQIVQRITKSLSIRLTKAKLAQIIPAAGAVIGGGFNAYFTAKVCESAYFLYRERFLAMKYGADIIEETVRPAPAGDFGTGYEQQQS